MTKPATSWPQQCLDVIDEAAAAQASPAQVQVQDDVKPDPWARERQRHQDPVELRKSARRLARHEHLMPWAAYASTVVSGPAPLL